MSSLNFLLCSENQMSARFPEPSYLPSPPPRAHPPAPPARTRLHMDAHTCTPQNCFPVLAALLLLLSAFHGIISCSPPAPQILPPTVHPRLFHVHMSLDRQTLCGILSKRHISPDSTFFALNGCCQHKSLAETVTEPDCSASILISELAVCL